MSLMFGRSVSHREWLSRLPFASDKVTVKNLHLTANAGFDVWGRQKVQPVDISISLSLMQPASSAAASDTVDASTVHYGQLSKLVIARVQQNSEKWITPEELAYSTTMAALEAAPNHTLLAALEVDVRFTKSTLYGEGMSVLFNFTPEAAAPSNGYNSELLHLSRLHVPALIGVNSNERTMKQMVVVSIWIDRVNPLILEHCFELEQLVFKTVEESSYETLESLAEELAGRTVKYFVLPHQMSAAGYPEVAGVRIKIEKPSAVPMADAPAVEVYRSAESQEAFGKRMMAELGNKRPQIPFPLAGRLDDFLKTWKQD
ncbi:hypothetical protein FH972_022697 [Carpinus fangiana]|uniref:dihydroneopterin aldolase n=1 Tax=Carpinus fangiana TaxID=176857 RepID=A0A5N6KSZ8_9ROSI|nr:hypothetical protein FH972_022697 [Carpinus fangiana]